ncbi:hypothetical protein NKI39_11465 [Mesorhizobium sp. M0664]|uniref:hypothetical protein n=1 Tax=Mesorhizobium sp. M0664 TaxID=2956982 RepID=UPI00333B519E
MKEPAQRIFSQVQAKGNSALGEPRAHQPPRRRIVEPLADGFTTNTKAIRKQEVVDRWGDCF